MTSIVQNLLVPLVTVVGLVVLMALNKVDSSVAIPLIAGIAGVHTGAVISSNSANVSSVDDKVKYP